MELKNLIKAVKKKDRKAQRLLVDTFSPLLYTISLRYMKNREDAKDVLQDALILIFKNIEQFSSEASHFKAWASRITVNVAVSRFRKSSKLMESYPGDMPDTKQFPNILEQLKVQDLMELLNQLPPLQRQVFNMFIIDGFSHSEIANLLNLKESYSRTLLTRARQKMQNLVFQSTKIRS